MILKPNPIYDVYEGEAPVKFSQMINPTPLAVILRASLQFLGTRSRRADYEVINYVAQCRASGIQYGLYHFLTPNGIAEQAALFLSVWNQVGGSTIAPIVDVEVDLVKSYPHATKAGESSIGHAVWQSHVKTFIDLIAAGTGKTPIIYTNQNYWNFVCTQNIIKQWVAPTWTADYPLWVAQYPTSPDTATKPAALPRGWTDWIIWQYNDKGRSNGFLVNDLNTASAKFALELEGNEPPPQPDPEDDEINEATIILKKGDGTIISADFERKTEWK